MNDIALKKFKQRLVETMRHFDKFCNDNNLAYFACSGTAIGAVRHQGFIPWDDDIDVYMPRDDYNRLMECRCMLEGTGYAVKNLGDDDYIYAFAKFYDINTTLVELKSFPTCVLGVYIDIFPLDEVSGTIDEIKSKKEQYKKAYTAFQDTYREFYVRTILSFLYHKKFRRCLNLLAAHLSSQNRKKRIRHQFIRMETEWAKERGNRVMTHSCIYRLEKELFQKEWFDEYELYTFENIKIRLSKSNDKYLTQLFGDYMTPPPVEKRVSAHSHYYLNLREGLAKEEVRQRIKKGENLVY